MAVEEMSEGVEGLVAAGGAGAPRPVPWDVARLLSYLAHLLDERIAVRGVGGLMEFAAKHLGDPRVATDLLLRLAAEAGYQPPTGLTSTA